MFSKVNSAGILGIEGSIVHVEADVSDGLPGFTMVGYLSSEVREAQDRVRTALKNSGFKLPARKITINLSPADKKKEGTAFDLPVAVAVLAAYGIIEPTALRDSVFIGELGLNGEIKPVHGTLPIVLAARNAGFLRCFLPKENMKEGVIAGGMDMIGVETVKKLTELLNQPELIAPAIYRDQVSWEEQSLYEVDFSEVNGQTLLKRAAEISVAGQHNLLLIGPAGTGKTMVAQRIPTIMPSLTRAENIEISKIYSVCGLLPPEQPLFSRRPFRSPHHTVSARALAGGGGIPKPGEISLASGGVLFLDEFPEFQKHTIEILRQPLEERRITISRVHGSYEFPADFMLVAAMNPCSCGYYPDRNKCTCSASQVRAYLGRISKPLLDRIDICVEASPVTYDEMHQVRKNETSETIRARVECARKIQKDRFPERKKYFNSSMTGRDIREFCRLKKEDEIFLKSVFQTKGLSARAYEKILKVARTIADLAGEADISHSQLCEAIGYRTLEEKFWGGTCE